MQMCCRRIVTVCDMCVKKTFYKKVKFSGGVSFHVVFFIVHKK